MSEDGWIATANSLNMLFHLKCNGESLMKTYSKEIRQYFPINNFSADLI